MIIFFILFICGGIMLIRFGFELWRLAIIFFLFAFLLLLCGGIDADAHEYLPSDIVMMGKVLNHEAPHESELGQRLVIDTILNRVESDKFPNTVYDVLTQAGQYCMPDKYGPSENYKLIAEEIYTRTNDQVLWYRTKKYHTYGVPIIKEGSHYFSGGVE